MLTGRDARACRVDSPWLAVWVERKGHSSMEEQLAQQGVFRAAAMVGLYVVLDGALYFWLGARAQPVMLICAALAFLPAIWLTMRSASAARGAMPRRWRMWTLALATEMLELLSIAVTSGHPVSAAWRSVPALFAVLSFTVYLFLATTPGGTDGSRIPALVDLVLAGAVCVSFDMAFLLPHGAVTLAEWTTFLTLLRVIALAGALLAVRAARNAEEYRLMRLVAIFLGADLAVVFLLNQVMAGLLHRSGATALDALMSVPPLVAAIWLKFRRRPAFTSAGRSRYVVRSGMSLFLTLTLLGAGVWLLPRHTMAGAIAMVVATVGFGIRAVAVHSYVMESEDKLRMSVEHFRGLADHDPLTSAWNRRMFDTSLRRLLEGAKTGDAVALLLLDIDHFKEFNDVKGHPYGDRCLTGVADALGRATRLEADLVCRLGGDEFGVILPRTALAGAREVAERIRREVKALGLGGPTDEALTVSVGVAVCPALTTMSLEELVLQADRQLYHAKRMGRNRVEWAFEEAPMMEVEVKAG